MVYPDYYPKFHCIAEQCKHNCCIGWEIDIDEKTLHFYDQLPGELGKKLRAQISRYDVPHFRLGQHDRCPFLQDNNLCELVLTLGEEHLCQICTDHPRFRNELPGRLEIGIGLCCEAAGSLILGKKEPTRLLSDEALTEDDEIIAIRDEAILILQNRSLPMAERLQKMLYLCHAHLPKDVNWAEFFLSLERLDEAWTKLMEQYRVSVEDFMSFDQHMAQRQTEYEQFCVYLAYRHMANAADRLDLAARAAFVALGYEIIHTIGAILYDRNGHFDFEDQVELARHFSAEIEYSEDNLEAVFDELAFENA